MEGDMGKYRQQLPQLGGDFFITDGGIETTLIFHDGHELPEFAAFDLLGKQEGREAIQRYFKKYAAIAKRHDVGFIFETATYRASPDWGKKLGYSVEQLDAINRDAIELVDEIRQEFEISGKPMVISGCVGPKGDGYNPDSVLAPEEAERYHSTQVRSFGESAADMVTALTMTHAEEAIGITRACEKAGLPVVISFTVETDGRLPTGQTLKAAIEQVDEATGNAPAYYMVNCAHTTHYDDTLKGDEDWLQRIRGFRSNASALSHAELEEAEELDDGDPIQFGRQHRDLLERLSHVNVLGGCCGTDHRHVEEICSARL
jgi:S-methylmethionine-dependent homocysteine/selenocysteine methylase